MREKLGFVSEKGWRKREGFEKRVIL